MESDWRFNLWDVGMAGLSYRFAGKLLVPIPVVFPAGVEIDYILYPGPTPAQPYYGIATDTSAYTDAPGLIFWFSSVGAPKWPGPFLVEPD